MPERYTLIICSNDNRHHTLNLREEYNMNPTSSNSNANIYGCPPSFFTAEGHDKEVRDDPKKYREEANKLMSDAYWLKATLAYIKLVENNVAYDDKDRYPNAYYVNLVTAINQQFWMAYGYGDPEYAKPLTDRFNFSKLSTIVSSFRYMDFDPPEFEEKVKPHLLQKAEGLTIAYNALIADVLSWLESKTNENTTLAWLASKAEKNDALARFKLKVDEDNKLTWLELEENEENNSNWIKSADGNDVLTLVESKADDDPILTWLKSKIDENGDFARLPPQIKTFVILELLGIIRTFCLTTVDISYPNWGPPSLNDVNEKREAFRERLELINGIWKDKKIDMKINIDAVVEQHEVDGTAQENINKANQGGWNIPNCIIS